MADWIKTGENPHAAGKVTYGIEGQAPAFTIDSSGNLTIAGVISAGASWLNVKSAAYGAKGDGVTDDTAAILAAIAAAAAAGGGVVYIPAGTYVLSASLVFTADNIRLVGDGRDLTILQPATGAQFDVISTPIPASAGTAGYVRQYLGVEQLAIDGSKMTGTVAGKGNAIHFYGVRYSYLRDLYLTGCPNWGILLDGDITNFSYSVDIRFCRIVNGAAGIMVTFSEEAFITCNDILQANVTTAAQQPAFAPQSNTGYLVRLISGYTGLIGNVIGSSGTYTSPAIQVENAGPTRIIGNRFDQARYQAIKTNAANTLIIGNQIGNPSSVGSVEGIRLGAGSATIVGNKFDVTNGAAHFTYCIAEAAAESNNIIQGNNLVSGTAGTISLNAASTGNRVSGNIGYNPVGAFGAQPAVPATTVAYTNNFGVDAMVHVAGGTVSAIAVGGTATGQTSGSFRVPSGQTITLTYTVAPTWVWFGD